MSDGSGGPFLDWRFDTSSRGRLERARCFDLAKFARCLADGLSMLSREDCGKVIAALPEKVNGSFPLKREVVTCLTRRAALAREEPKMSATDIFGIRDLYDPL